MRTQKVYKNIYMRRFLPHNNKLLNHAGYDRVYKYNNLRRFLPQITVIVNHMADNMTENKHILSSLAPYGLVMTRPWLLEQGVERHTVDNWVKSGKLIAVARGVFIRPETELTWQGVIYSLQRMGYALRVGGLTALTLQGMAHYLSPNADAKIHLYGTEKLPPWLNEILPDTLFIKHTGLGLNTLPNKDGLHTVPYGIQKFFLLISSPEQAFLEVLLDVPDSVSFEHADQLMQGLPTLSPQRLNQLLHTCKNIKVKRLFLWLAERNQSPWLKRIDCQNFSMESGTLGSGKRVIAKGGRLDPKYLITVPKDMAGEFHG